LNILTETLPTAVLIDGVEYLINTDFRTCIRIILAFEDSELTANEKQMIMINSLYPQVPSNIGAAIEQGTKFLNGGKESEPNDDEPVRVYSFSKDANFIYSAFRSTHGIDLQKTNLHWFEFLSLFMDLGSETTFCNLISLRKRVKDGTASKEEKQTARDMGDIFDIPEPDNRTLEEREKEAQFMQLVGAK
jgi:hypothetical protein